MFLDPDGARYGTPTWPWRMAPDHLVTRRQLAAMGLRPVGEPVGQLMWRSRRASSGIRTAALYHLAHTVQRTPPTERRLAQLAAARARRRICPGCHRDAGYVIPARLGVCLDCHDRTDLAA